MNFFNDLSDFSPSQIGELIATARRLDEHPEPRALEGKVLSLLFLNPSLRTLASFQSAMTRLGGGVFVISPEMSIHRMESRAGIVMDGAAAEHIREAVPVIASYSDAIGIRASAKCEYLADDLTDVDFKQMTSLVDIPYINMESAINHPCQSLADWKTMDDLHIPAKGKFVLSWSWHPQPMPLAVPAATIAMAAMRGMDVTVLRPQGYSLPAAVMAKARAAASLSGGSVAETDDRNAAMDGANVLYVNSWSSEQHYGLHRAEEDFKHTLRHWCIDEPWFTRAAEGCRFMHPLPVRREVTVAEDVLDGSRSIVIAGARNRMLVQMAVLYRMLSGNGSGNGS